jgi:hypothetical protein
VGTINFFIRGVGVGVLVAAADGVGVPLNDADGVSVMVADGIGVLVAVGVMLVLTASLVTVEKFLFFDPQTKPTIPTIIITSMMAVVISTFLFTKSEFTPFFFNCQYFSLSVLLINKLN